MNTFRQSSNAGFLTAKDSQQHLKIQLLKIQNFIRGLELETTLNLHLVHLSKIRKTTILPHASGFPQTYLQLISSAIYEIYDNRNIYIVLGIGC